MNFSVIPNRIVFKPEIDTGLLLINLKHIKMPQKTPDKDINHEDWWDEKPDKAKCALHNQAVEDYLTFHDDDVEHVKFSIDLVKKMIPHVAVRDANWKKFPKDSFQYNGPAAHADLYQTIHNKISTLQDAARESRERIESAKQMEAIEAAVKLANLDKIQKEQHELS